MCRFTVYKGQSLLLGDLIVKPENSLLRQSRDAGWHPGVLDPKDLRNIRVNGDGFGVSWYGETPEQGSCCFKFITPAWSNGNLRNIGHFIESSVVFAHVRAAANAKHSLDELSTGVSYENCHPFTFGRWTFMHNGGIPQFCKIKRALVNLLSEDCYAMIEGSTDSEHIFYLFLTILGKEQRYSSMPLDITAFAVAVELTVANILKLCQDAGVYDQCSLNLCFTDGTNIICTRYRNDRFDSDSRVRTACSTPGDLTHINSSDAAVDAAVYEAQRACPPRSPGDLHEMSTTDEPPSLYYCFGSGFECNDGHFKSNDHESASEIVITSAPLSREGFRSISRSASRENIMSSPNKLYNLAPSSNWILIPRNHMLICVGDENDVSKINSIYLHPVHSEPINTASHYACGHALAINPGCREDMSVDSMDLNGTYVRHLYKLRQKLFASDMYINKKGGYVSKCIANNCSDSNDSLKSCGASPRKPPCFSDIAPHPSTVSMVAQAPAACQIKRVEKRDDSATFTHFCAFVIFVVASFYIE